MPGEDFIAYFIFTFSANLFFSCPALHCNALHCCAVLCCAVLCTALLCSALLGTALRCSALLLHCMVNSWKGNRVSLLILLSASLPLCVPLIHILSLLSSPIQPHYCTACMPIQMSGAVCCPAKRPAALTS